MLGKNLEFGGRGGNADARNNPLNKGRRKMGDYLHHRTYPHLLGAMILRQAQAADPRNSQ